MRTQWYLILCALFVLLPGCASAPQTKAILRLSAAELPRAAQVRTVPFVEQTDHFCGPASMAMVLGWAGRPASLEELGQQMYTPGKEGTLQSDVVSVARRHGMLALPVANLKDVLSEVAAGNPVLVFQNLGFSWYRKWHYAVAIGYDLDDETVLLHSGHTASERSALSSFERTFSLGGNWAVAVLPPGKLSVTSDEFSHVQAAAALEQAGQSRDAAVAYEAVLKKWPTSVGALIGLGNARYALGDYAGSANALERATRLSPKMAATWHNLAFAFQAQKKRRSAKAAARRALQLVSIEQSIEYLESLASVLGD